MSEARRFYSSVKDAQALNDVGKIELFVYFITEIEGSDVATTQRLTECFRECSLTPPKTIPQILNRGLTSNPKRYVKGNVGYKLEYHRRDELAKLLGAETHTVQVPPELRELEGKLPEGVGKTWFKEAMDCYGVEAYRAALIMTWIFALDHLLNYILAHKLVEFNAALAAHPDQRTVKKVGLVTARDDFGPIGEEMLLDLCKTAKIVSADVRRIMGVALGVRNTAAHPSGVVVTRSKFVTIAEDLVLNVVLKYLI
ncbi:hypothetical protein [Mesorhizobium sp. M7A.F.Ce.TU.012.03.2.1]|uniref:hypothetical protein n=1 Tax=Mesorhizobium sp. M7A.F.Ce.TU.012.03.2.1 TaxID=2493681 RepID=UPI000FD8BE77|nr:hypothetical protein [Mesorhizobium sp. M7A.F.Ce.TU.012.03.2.1]AZV22654.1 hypothetical protein EJ079_28260 [Mesorhizobium sp. M7A.F.Ce.TU.012.03.2.1]